MWPRVVNVAVGLWLMAAPAVLGYQGTAADVDRIAGPVIAAIAAVGVTEATRSVRWANLPAGLLLLAAPLLLDYPAAAAVNSVVCGLCVAGLSLVRGRLSREIGGGWAALLRRERS